jgi:hypothetical protein
MKRDDDAEFDEAMIMRISRQVADILRTNAIVASRLRDVGLPKGATMSETADYLDKILAELKRRRAAKDGDLAERLVAFAQEHGMGYLSHIDSIFDAMSDKMLLYRRFEFVMQKMGRSDIIQKIEAEADNESA